VPKPAQIATARTGRLRGGPHVRWWRVWLVWSHRSLGRSGRLLRSRDAGGNGRTFNDRRCGRDVSRVARDRSRSRAQRARESWVL